MNPNAIKKAKLDQDVQIKEDSRAKEGGLSAVGYSVQESIKARERRLQNIERQLHPELFPESGRQVFAAAGGDVYQYKTNLPNTPKKQVDFVFEHQDGQKTEEINYINKFQKVDAGPQFSFQKGYNKPRGATLQLQHNRDYVMDVRFDQRFCQTP